MRPGPKEFPVDAVRDRAAAVRGLLEAEGRRDPRGDHEAGLLGAMRLVANLGERVEAWTADDWDEVDWGAEALDLEPSDDADLIIAVYSKHDGKVVDVRGFNTN